jgi:S-DNA-T family DNA segregation ATPase FtsK/SpoIIIE
MKLYICAKEGCVSNLTTCPVCRGKMKKYEKKQDSKKAKRFPRELTPQVVEQRRVSKIIEEKCADFRCPGEVEYVKAGPMVTVYGFRPYRFTRLRELKTLHEDLAVAIPAESVTVMRNPGTMHMNITVPNNERAEVNFEQTLKAVVEHRYDMDIPINLGVSSIGEPCVVDLARMPHLLIAGSTGTGKSVCLNGILTSLLYVRSPKQIQLFLIDPKSVELLPYSGLPHVRRPPVSAVMDALGMMANIIEEMKKRMAFLYFQKVKNLKELNAKLKAQGQEELPYWILVIDEMGDLIIHEKKLFTEAMTQISSMARAAGIHVIAATQRPSVDILSGKIKVNFPARVGLRLPSTGDSKTVFGRAGAEQLLGKGDMFFMSPDLPGLQRLHAPYCREEDIQKMIHLSSEMGHVNNVPADGLPPAKPTAPAPTPEPEPAKEPKQEQPEQISHSLYAFLRERNMTWEQAKNLPPSEKALLNGDYKEFQRKRRLHRNSI